MRFLHVAMLTSALTMIASAAAAPVAALECVTMDEILETAPTSWPVFKPVTFASGTKMKLWTWHFLMSDGTTGMDNPTIMPGNQCGGSNSPRVLHENASGLYGQIAGGGVDQVVFKTCNFNAPGNLSGDAALAQFVGDISTVAGQALTGPFGDPVAATATPVASGLGHELTLSGGQISAFIVGADALDIAEVCIEP